jgi:DNA polymerase
VSDLLPKEDARSKTERLAELAEQARTCSACSLSRTRANVVFGMGNPEAPLVIIGEGPGQNEDSTGLPFVGRSGQFLDERLKECGITRKHIYICNVIRCRACAYEAGRLQNRPPTADEVKACQPWLEQTLQIIQPLVILCLGSPSANAIIHRNFRITQERGGWYESKYAPHAMASWHPAYILRLEGEAYDRAKEELTNDVEAARKRVIQARKDASRLTLF